MQEEERERQAEERRRAVENAKREFEEAIMGGRFPCDGVLATLANDDSDIPVNLKEAVEELLFGRCSLRSITFSDAVVLIRQRQRVEERAKARAARGDEPIGPVTKTEAFELLGVAPGCTSEELAAAYHRVIGQWHPDRLDAMADELKAFATNRASRINEAFRLLKAQV